MKNRSANNQNTTASMVVRMTPEMKSRLEKTALSEGLSAAELIRRAIQRELDARERDQSVKAEGVFVSYSELDKYIEKFLDRKMRETKAKNGGKD